MKRQTVPAYGYHKGSGQARCYVKGRSVYLGEYGSEASRILYGEIVAKIVSGQPIDPLIRQKTPVNNPKNAPGISVAELLLAFKHHAEKHYLHKDGTPTDEIACFASAMKPVRELYALIPASDFGPLHLKAVRDRYITNGWCRGYCNKSTNRIRHIWKWGVENGMVPVTTLQALQAVSPLKSGRTTAPDHKLREAVPEENIEAVRLHLTQNHRDLFDLLRATGARPSELLSISMTDIDTTPEVWVADLKEHKNAYRGMSRKLFFGPKSQEILKRLPASGPLFKFTRRHFSTIVKRACLKAKVTPFVPYELRHTKATELRDTMSIEAAQACLGHAQPTMTARYSSKMDSLASEAAKARG
jgi:integrase